MGEVLQISVALAAKAATVQEAWDAWVAADTRAKETRNIEDGIRAGKAWRIWLELFTVKR
jgi:hypothetical protein